MGEGDPQACSPAAISSNRLSGGGYRLCVRGRGEHGRNRQPELTE
jgi:hypothetical protein